ncbi:MAG TPA: hypothetical protein VNV66_22605 [Pilimelia sp.]|nr:hypothetical protein [Pilimelia sp.]
MEAKTELETLADFFDRYGTALLTGDLPVIAGCYALPGMVVSDAYNFTFSSPAAVALSFVGASSAYRELELVAAHAEIGEVQRLSDGLVLVSVAWEYLDSRGAPVPGERFRYVVRLADPPQICVVLPMGAATP